MVGGTDLAPRNDAEGWGLSWGIGIVLGDRNRPAASNGSPMR